jgi:threonine/homoserine/homoserine lactone efflux protein
MPPPDRAAGRETVIDAATLTTYILIVLGFVFVPGPATLLTMTRATTSGTRIGIATGLGIAVGDMIHTAMAVFGISALISASAFLFSIVKYAGAAYLIYLGIRAIRAPAAIAVETSPDRLTFPAAFKQAILAEVLNPKTALFFFAFLPQFVRPGNGPVLLQLTLLSLILVALGLRSTITFAVSAASLGSFLRRNPIVLRWQGKAAGSIYCALGARLAFQDR